MVAKGPWGLSRGSKIWACPCTFDEGTNGATVVPASRVEGGRANRAEQARVFRRFRVSGLTASAAAAHKSRARRVLSVGVQGPISEECHESGHLPFPQTSVLLHLGF